MARWNRSSGSSGVRPREKRQNPSSPAPSRARAVDDGLRAAVREDGDGVGRPVDVADDDVVVEVLRLRLGGRPRAGGVDADDRRRRASPSPPSTRSCRALRVSSARVACRGRRQSSATTSAAPASAATVFGAVELVGRETSTRELLPDRANVCVARRVHQSRARGARRSRPSPLLPKSSRSPRPGASCCVGVAGPRRRPSRPSAVRSAQCIARRPRARPRRTGRAAAPAAPRSSAAAASSSSAAPRRGAVSGVGPRRRLRRSRARARARGAVPTDARRRRRARSGRW